MIDLTNTRCPCCTKPDLVQITDVVEIDEIGENGIRCKNCGQNYPIIWGVPYLGFFSEDEMVSLLEIACHADLYPINGIKDNLDVLKWINIIDEYTNSPNRSEVLRKNDITEKPSWFDNRYYEHLLFRILTQKIMLRGKSLLDVGASTGYDSMKYVGLGAEVTGLEFNPLLSARGSLSFPSIRWVGGSSHRLPFADSCFDVVVGNAALHHFTDIPQAISEMLRVLRPEGYLLTIGDSFCRNDTTEEREAQIFNDHSAVLMGVNEQLPKFASFADVLKQHSELLDIRIITITSHTSNPYLHEWELGKGLKQLPFENGNISFVVKKKSPMALTCQTQKKLSLTPAEFAKFLHSQSEAVARVVDLIPDEYVDLDVLDKNYPKFRLLNGWKLPIKGDDKRGVYGKCRLFFSIDKARFPYVFVSFLSPYVVDTFDSPRASISVNGRVVSTCEVTRGLWHKMYIPIDAAQIESKQNFSLEIGIENTSNREESKQFYVRDVKFTNDTTSIEPDELPEMECFGLETLVTTGVIKNGVKVLLSRDFDHCLDIINRLRNFRLSIDLVVANGQKALYSWIPDVRSIHYYPDCFSEKPDPSVFMMAQGTDVLLVVSPDSKSAKELHEMIPNRATIKNIFAIMPKGYAYLSGSALSHSKNCRMMTFDGTDPVRDSNPVLGRMEANELRKIAAILTRFHFLLPALQRILKCIPSKWC